jgi:RNA polymerase sigma factor (sigma-70 family)
MQDINDLELLDRYATKGCEEAFATLVTRHVNLVYSVALRHVGNPHLAEEVTQAVFVLLARKAHLFGKRTILQGWLHKTAWFTADNVLKTAIRQQRREQEAYMQSLLNEPESDAWAQVAPLLDTAIAGLNEKDRNAIVLRFFDGRKLSEVGAALGTSEGGATKRVNRAVEKLREYFARRGVVLSAATLTAIIAANSVQAAPAGLATAATTASLAGAAGTGLSGLVTTITKFILMYKKSCAVLGIALAAAVAVPLIVVKAGQTDAGPPPFKYGLYLHFDISTFAGYRGAKDIGHVAPGRYAPTRLDVAGWVRTAKQAGMDCAVLTVKHEAGFCLWDADDYDYDVASSPVKTDVVAEFISACKAEGILPGIHYSIPDAHNEGTVVFNGPVSAEYFEFIKKQTKELHTKYPDIKVQVFDIAFRLSKSQLQELSQTVKQLNPSCSILCELGNTTKSKYVCDTVNKGWLWSPGAQLTPVQELYAKYFQTRAEGLPFLLNVGPDRSGHIPNQYTATLMELKRLIGQNPPQ